MPYKLAHVPLSISVFPRQQNWIIGEENSAVNGEASSQCIILLFWCQKANDKLRQIINLYWAVACNHHNEGIGESFRFIHALHSKCKAYTWFSSRVVSTFHRVSKVDGAMIYI